MVFKVKDLMVSVGGDVFDGQSTCTGWTRPTGTGCLDSLLFNAEAAPQGLAVLRAQLRQVIARS